MKFNRKIVTVLLSGLLLAMAACSNTEPTTTVEEVRETPVAVYEAFTGSLSGSNQITGTTKASSDIMLIPKSAGQLTSVNISVGDKVQKGQTIAVIESRDQQIGLESDQNQLKQAQNGLERAINGQSQAKGNHENAKLNLQLIERQLEELLKNLERNQFLYEEGLISKVDLERLEMDVFALEQQIEQAKINIAATEASIRDTEIAQKDAEVAVQQANLAIKMSQKRIEDTQIKAPVSGTIASIEAEVGEMVSNQAPFARIISLDVIDVEVTVTAEQLILFETGDEVEVLITGQEESYNGQVHSISPTANDSGLFGITIQVTNEGHMIKPGMIATVIIEEVLTDESVIIPTAAILERLDTTYIFVVENDIAVRKEVEVIRFDTEYTAITGEITPGEEVIVKGQNLISDGDAVRIVREDK